MTLNYYWNSIMTRKEREIMTHSFREKGYFAGHDTDVNNAKDILYIAFVDPYAGRWAKYWQACLRRIFGDKWVARAIAMDITND